MFVVDWGYLAKIPCYPAAAYNTKYVGKCVADLLIRLSLKYNEFKPYDVHIIGFRYVLSTNDCIKSQKIQNIKNAFINFNLCILVLERI